MDEETSWVLKMLSERKISAQSANRILRALELQRETVERRAAGLAETTQQNPKELERNGSDLPSAETRSLDTTEAQGETDARLDREIAEMKEQEVAGLQETDSSVEDTRVTEPREEGKQDFASETKSDIADQEPIEDVAEEAEMEREVEASSAEETTPESIVWAEMSDIFQVEDGVCTVVTTPNFVRMILEKSAGDVIIQSWDQSNMRVESVEDSFTVLQAEDTLKIRSENHITIYVPPTIEEISIAMTDMENRTSEIVVDSNTKNVNVKGARGTVSVRSIEGNITVAGCSGVAWLESESGDITVRSASALRENSSSLPKSESEVTGAATEQAPKLNVKSGSGKVVLADINGDIDAKSSGGNITMQRCRSQSINAESDGGSLELRHIASDMVLKGQNGYILVEDFFGVMRLQARDTDVSISKSGDAEIHIDSDGGDISIEDCYADAYVNSGTGDVRVFGGDLSFSAMGKIELKMETGGAYLSRRTFEDVQIAIGNGDVELNMEKLDPGGSGRISVYRGNIALRASPDFRCEMTAHASRKKIYTSLPIEIIEEDKNQIYGMMNGGGAKIELIAPNGEIRLEASPNYGKHSQVSQSMADRF